MTAPKKRTAKPKTEWHLICITEKGKVSMLKNLDLYSARETYKRLLPGTRPKKHVYPPKCDDPKCSWCRNGSYGGGGGWFSGSGNGDRLSRVEAIGPESVELDPWFGVEPEIVDHSYRCTGARRAKPPEWDDSRTDFWNDPKLWEGAEPDQRLCWDRSKKWKSSILSTL